MFKRKGFTIIELLMVITIIAILVGLALPRFKGMQDEGNIAKAKGELRTLQTGVESFYIHANNTFPSALSNLTAATTIPNIVGNTLPTDPFNGTSNYGYSTSGNYYVVYSTGPSGNGTASVSSNGTITETNGANCIYVTNGNTRDTQP